MTPDQLRAALIADLNEVLTAPAVKWFVTAAQRARIEGQIAYWQAAPEAVLSQLLALIPAAKER